MPFYQLNQLGQREIMPGFHGKFIHSDHMTMAYWNINQGARLPEHSHPHEQVVNLLQGEFELVVDGERRKLQAGSVAVIPSGALHSGHAITYCEILDIFQPVREEYKV